MQNITTRPTVVLLDVYETLLDMSPVERKVNKILGNKLGYTLWFELLLQYCFVDNSTDKFHDFTSIASSTLKMCGHRLNEKVTNDDVENVLTTLRYLPVHEDVQEGLSALYDLGLRIVALTNIPEVTVRERMETTGLISYFERLLTAEKIGKYKPAKEVYAWAAKELKVDAADVLLVTSHGWDIAGADNAGMLTAYKKHERQMLYSLSNDPDLQIKDLIELGTVLKKLPVI
ncbi:MAG: haloacid dehalogenase type II [Chitinophagaceae bacterium]|nr:MAG: haloacid dehalogenase type II [Chitinophagaceae bacterium]